MAETPNLNITFVEADQAQKHVTLNEALLQLDAIVQLSVISRSLIEPRVSPEPQDGDRYIVPPVGGSPDIIEEWEGKNDNIAVLQDGVWQFIEPNRGWFAFVLDEDGFVQWDGTQWGAFNVALGPGTVENAELADMAAATVKGRASGAGTGVPQDLVDTQLKTILGIETGIWTPVFTFATPGNLSVGYTAQQGTYVKIGKVVIASCVIVTSSFTHSSAAGFARITGLPYTVGLTAGSGGLVWAGITLATHTSMVAQAVNATTYQQIVASGSGQARQFIGVGQMPSGGSVELRATVIYEV